MNCNEARECMHAQLDGWITAPQRAAFEAHVAGCEPCRRTRSQFAAMVDAFEWLADDGPSSSERGAAKTPSLAGAWRLAVWGLAAAAVIAAAVILPEYRPGGDSGLDVVDAHAAETAFAVELLGETHDDYIALQEPAAHPRVHIVWLVPTAPPAERRPSPQSSLKTIHL